MVDNEVSADLFWNYANFTVFAMLAKHPKGLTLEQLRKPHFVPNCEVDRAVAVLHQAGAVATDAWPYSIAKFYPREGGIDAFTRFACFVEEQCWVKAKKKKEAGN